MSTECRCCVSELEGDEVHTCMNSPTEGVRLRLTETLAGSGRLRRPASQPSARHGGCLRTLRAEPQVRQARNVKRNGSDSGKPLQSGRI
jgi:hypothetical protein